MNYFKGLKYGFILTNYIKISMMRLTLLHGSWMTLLTLDLGRMVEEMQESGILLMTSVGAE